MWYNYINIPTGSNVEVKSYEKVEIFQAFNACNSLCDDVSACFMQRSRMFGRM